MRRSASTLITKTTVPQRKCPMTGQFKRPRSKNRLAGRHRAAAIPREPWTKADREMKPECGEAPSGSLPNLGAHPMLAVQAGSAQISGSGEGIQQHGPLVVRQPEQRPEPVLVTGPLPWATSVIPGYTAGMKTAISVPDEIFEQASGQAAELGISRSEFFARAARRYLDELAAQSLTRQIDQALLVAGDDDSGAAAAAAGRGLLGAGDDDW